MVKQFFLILVWNFIFIYAFSQVYEWRGDGRNGVYDEKGLMTKWPESGPEIIWLLENLPKGYSSPSIAYNTIYVTGVKDSSDVLTAIGMDGNVKWQIPYGKAWLKNYPASRSTPTINEERIYITSGMGEVVCVDAITGAILWKVDAHNLYDGEYDRWGLAESVLLLDNKVFYTTGGNLTTIIALDKDTGETIWISETLNDQVAFCSPLLIENNGNRLVISLTKTYLFAVDPDNGQIVWKFNFAKYAGKRAYNNHANTPLFYDNGIFLTSGYDHKGLKISVIDNLKAISVDWINDVLDNHHGGVVKIGNYIYGSTWDNNSNGKWACVNWSTGETMYEEEWINKGQIIAANGYLYCFDEKYGNIALVKADPQYFKVVSSFKVTVGQKGPFWAHPVIDNGILYIRHEDALVAYNIRE